MRIDIFNCAEPTIFWLLIMVYKTHCWLLEISEKLGENFQLQQLDVYWLTIRGMNWTKLRWDIVPQLMALLPDDVLYFQVADNDLDSQQPVKDIIQKYLWQTKVCLDSLGAKRVIISSALPSNSTRHISPDVYMDRVANFNRQLSDILTVGGISHGPIKLCCGNLIR